MSEGESGPWAAAAATYGTVGAMVNSTTFASAARAFSALVDRLPTDRWDAPALGGWDLRALTGHTNRALITVSTYLKRPAVDEVFTSPEAYYAAIGTGTITAADRSEIVERGRIAGAALGLDPALAVRSLVSQVLSEVDRPDDPVIETIAGGMRLSTYLPTRTFELAVHSLDIEAATGVEARLPDQVLAETVELAARITLVRGDGASVLMALTGRRTLPDGFSVV